DERWQARASAFNLALEQGDLPLRVAALSSIWTVNYHQPSRYHWLLQFYLREAGLALSWVGTGRFVFSLNHTDADMAEVTRRVLAACERMRADGWWWQAPGVTAKMYKRQVLKELLLQRLTGQAV
ncbi:MAG: glutamate-1-semialdehyde 2,1-aminomutase, partial [Rubrivivax sp.]